ncbi:MAG: acyl-CoA dehydrogenase family protein [Defluviitaleaceae bacterium]|nr:acyl-CoA dehydrogenase family protein [Defluviitaleaceae bacterium]MCL2835524.1 acyl-CoA dehydrogenase family protein [Defluviitaleaceae bacterium]
MIFQEKHELIRKLAKGFADRELTSEVLDEAEERGYFDRALLDKMGKIGFFGIKTPKELGGQGSDCLAYVIATEEMCRASAAFGLYISTQNSLVSMPIMISGSREQKEKYMPPISSGEYIGAFGLTEPGAGSDAGGMTTRAVLDGDYYILSGRKTFITGAPTADIAIIYAKTDPDKGLRGISTFVMDMRAPGVSLGKPENKLGIRGCPTSDIIMENVRVHKSGLLGDLGRGFANAMGTLDIGRIGIAAQAIGIGQACLDESVKYANERKQFGKRIGEFQGVSFKLADMYAKLQAAKELTYQAALLVDAGVTGGQISLAASTCKLYSAEAVNQIAYDAIQIHGGYGFMKDYRVERLYRDARILPIYEGTSEVQKMVMAAQLLKR